MIGTKFHFIRKCKKIYPSSSIHKSFVNLRKFVRLQIYFEPSNFTLDFIFDILHLAHSDNPIKVAHFMRLVEGQRNSASVEERIHPFEGEIIPSMMEINLSANANDQVHIYSITGQKMIKNAFSWTTSCVWD